MPPAYNDNQESPHAANFRLPPKRNSKAVNNAFSSYDKCRPETNSLYNATMIEVNDLFEAFYLNVKMDRTDHGNLERKEYMQRQIELKVDDVRTGRLSSEKATRIIHSIACVLGFELSMQTSRLTCVLWGMDTNVTRSDIYESMKKFGEIDKVALATGNKGFAICRFKSCDAVRAAIEGSFHEKHFVQDLYAYVHELTPTFSAYDKFPPLFIKTKKAKKSALLAVCMRLFSLPFIEKNRASKKRKKRLGGYSPLN
uniref:RRM domain-containing protein n=1 Tax=Corethron hystrix TaxID=216773 RepID=A0A7S1BIR8_9STRA